MSQPELPELPEMPPVPPESSDDHPLSQLAPGDDLRELIHELRNARAAIQNAEHVFVKRSEIAAKYSTKKELDATRRSAQRRFVALVIAIAALIAVGLTATLTYRSQQGDIHHEQVALAHEQAALQRLQYDSCQERNARDAESGVFLQRYFTILSESQDQQTAQKVIDLLQQFAKKAPPPLPNCSQFLH